MNMALHHPDVFGAVISLDGYYQAEGDIWGHNAVYIQQNSPAVLLPHDSQAWKLHIYLGSASQDQPDYNDTRQFMKELTALHIPYQFDLQNGYHSWGGPAGTDVSCLALDQVGVSQKDFIYTSTACVAMQ